MGAAITRALTALRASGVECRIAGTDEPAELVTTELIIKNSGLMEQIVALTEKLEALEKGQRDRVSADA